MTSSDPIKSESKTETRSKACTSETSSSKDSSHRGLRDFLMTLVRADARSSPLFPTCSSRGRRAQRVTSDAAASPTP